MDTFLLSSSLCTLLRINGKDTSFGGGPEFKSQCFAVCGHYLDCDLRKKFVGFMLLEHDSMSDISSYFFFPGMIMVL